MSAIDLNADVAAAAENVANDPSNQVRKKALDRALRRRKNPPLSSRVECVAIRSTYYLSSANKDDETIASIALAVRDMEYVLEDALERLDGPLPQIAVQDQPKPKDLIARIKEILGYCKC